MDDYFFKNDIILACKRVQKFPEGVQEAFESLHNAIPFTTDRKFMSISKMNKNGEIFYLAGAELFEGESFQNMEKFIFKKGKYRGTIIEDFMKDIPQLGKLFQELYKDPDLDPAGYCVEWYFNEKDVRCFVKLND
jgi:hypothetical protein